jgi:hypothetical protein
MTMPAGGDEAMVLRCAAVWVQALVPTGKPTEKPTGRAMARAMEKSTEGETETTTELERATKS